MSSMKENQVRLRELDKAIAETLLGWQGVECSWNEGALCLMGYPSGAGLLFPFPAISVPSYSTDRTAIAVFERQEIARLGLESTYLDALAQVSITEGGGHNLLYRMITASPERRWRAALAVFAERGK